jgi:hypothetical protein
VNVNFPKSADEKDLRDLLEDINKNPSNLPLRSALLCRPEVTASQYNASYRPVFAGKDRKLDVDATLASIQWLLDGNPYREEIGEYFLMNLEDILDAGQIQYIHPINGSKLPTNKVDELGLDFSLINSKVYRAYVWFSRECTINGGGAVLSELHRMTSRDIYKDMLSQGDITKKIVAKYEHACTSKSGAFIKEISIEWPTESRSYAPSMGQTRVMPTQEGRYDEKKPIGGELTTIQLRQLIEACLTAENVNTLAFDSFPRIYRSFTSGQTNSQRINDIIDHAQRQLEVTKLINAIWKICPNGYDNFMAKLETPQNPTTVVKQEGVYNINIAKARGISIGGSANGSTIITGDGNNNWL